MAQLREAPSSAAGATEEILLVDDDPNHREIYARRLGRLGHQVRTTASAAEAIEAVEAETPALVILDIAMPSRDGLSCLQELIALEPALPVIIHTAYPTFRDNFLTWAAEDYIEKSSDLQPLADAIERALACRKCG